MSKRIVIAILLVASGLYAVLQEPALFLNPGQVTTGHTKIEEECFQCHDFLLGPSDDKCITCHKISEIRVGKRGKVAFHQRLQEKRCVNCHTDHMGKDAAKATYIFDHSLLISSEINSCKKCHSAPEDRLHQNLVKQCNQCHGTEQWKPATLDHTRWFRFDRHHPEKCIDCHENKIFDRYTCYGCHEHSPSNVRREHLEEGIRDFQNCTACHLSGDEEEAERNWLRMRRGGISPSSVGTPSWIGERGKVRHERQSRHRDHDDDDD
jgi:hypothetical protein